jgi:hypothetical protein
MTMGTSSPNAVTGLFTLCKWIGLTGPMQNHSKLSGLNARTSVYKTASTAGRCPVGRIGRGIGFVCGTEFGQGGPDIFLALAGEPLLVRAKVGDPRLNLGAEIAGDDRPRDLDAGLNVLGRCGRRSPDVSAVCIFAASTGAPSTAGAAATTGLASTSSCASGSLPVTDCTKAMVCAIRRSRSSFQPITHLGPSTFHQKAAAEASYVLACPPPGFGGRKAREKAAASVDRSSLICRGAATYRIDS